MEPMNNTMLCFSIIASFVGGTTGLMPESFKQAIAANHMKLEDYLLEDSAADPKRHCDWVFVKEGEAMDKEGK